MKENEKKEILENEERSLSLPVNTTDMTMNLFGESKTKKITSLDLEKEDNIDMVLNSMQDADFKLNDCIGQEIEVIGVIITETPVESANEETGEVITRKKHAMTLFDKDRKSYVTGSNACYMSLLNIVALKGMPTEQNPITLVPVKVDAKEKGHQYLRLRVKTK